MIDVVVITVVIALSVLSIVAALVVGWWLQG